MNPYRFIAVAIKLTPLYLVVAGVWFFSGLGVLLIVLGAIAALVVAIGGSVLLFIWLDDNANDWDERKRAKNLEAWREKRSDS